MDLRTTWTGTYRAEEAAGEEEAGEGEGEEEDDGETQWRRSRKTIADLLAHCGCRWVDVSCQKVGENETQQAAREWRQASTRLWPVAAWRDVEGAEVVLWTR